MIIVLDTNVLVSGLLNGSGAPGQLLDRVLARKLTLTYDDRVLDEYSEVLRRPELGFDIRDVDTWLGFVEQRGILAIAAKISVDLPHLADVKFLEIAIAGNADALVTGNLRHFPDRDRFPVRIVSPREFIDSLTGR